MTEIIAVRNCQNLSVGTGKLSPGTWGVADVGRDARQETLSDGTRGEHGTRPGEGGVRLFTRRL